MRAFLCSSKPATKEAASILATTRRGPSKPLSTTGTATQNSSRRSRAWCSRACGRRRGALSHLMRERRFARRTTEDTANIDRVTVTVSRDTEDDRTASPLEIVVVDRLRIGHPLGEATLQRHRGHGGRPGGPAAAGRDGDGGGGPGTGRVLRAHFGARRRRAPGAVPPRRDPRLVRQHPPRPRLCADRRGCPGADRRPHLPAGRRPASAGDDLSGSDPSPGAMARQWTPSPWAGRKSWRPETSCARGPAQRRCGGFGRNC